MDHREPPSPSKSPQRWVAALERVKTQSYLPESSSRSRSEPGGTEHEFSSMDKRMKYQISRPNGGDASSSKRRSPNNADDEKKDEGRHSPVGNTLTDAALQSAIRSRQQQGQQPQGSSRSSSFRSRMLERHGGRVAQSYTQYRGFKSAGVPNETKSDVGVGTQSTPSTPDDRRRSVSRDRWLSKPSVSPSPPPQRRPTTPTRSDNNNSRLQEYRRAMRAQQQPLNEHMDGAADVVAPNTVTPMQPQQQRSAKPIITPSPEDTRPRSRGTTPTRSRATTPTRSLTTTPSRSRATTPTRSNSGKLMEYQRRIAARQQPDEQNVEEEDVDAYELPSLIQQIDDRAEIETPSPARVSDLRHKLWTDNEHLRGRWKRHNVQQNQQGTKLNTGLASPEQGRRFKERYYAAAQRGLAQQEAPKKTNEPEDEHHGELVNNLIAKLGTVNREDPHAALAQIDEILRTQTEGGNQVHDDDDASSEDSSVSSITDPTYEESSKSKLNRNASASAKGRTRPSALSKYAKPMKEVTGSSGNSKLRPRKHRGAFPSADEVAAEAKGEIAQPIASRSFAQIKRDIEIADDVRDEDVSGSGILDTGTDELEQKIKRWDELSTGIIPTKTEKETAVGKEENTATKSRPWQGALSPRNSATARRPAATPVVNVRDTTMSSADGVEAEYLSVGSQTDVTPIRKLRQERLLREQRPATIAEDPPAQGELTTQRSEAFEEFLPAFDPRREKAKAMAEDYDSAWINLPQSRYFGQSSQKQSSQRDNQRAAPDGFLKHLPDGEVEVGYMNMDKIDADQAISTGHRGMKVTSHDRIPVEDENSQRSRSGLKGFLNRKTDYQRRGEHLTYTSTGSRRYQDLKAKLEAKNSQRERPARNSRGNSDQSRARSLDERRESTGGTRNPNLAKKFSRLLKVYDDDKSRGHLSR